MGGKALKSTFTRRYNSEEYFQLVEELVPLVREAFQTDVQAVQAYYNKPSFGDMDLLVKKNDYPMDVRQIITDIFSPNEIHSNGNVWSFDYKQFQIDLIFTKAKYWESSINFFAWNDLGNLMGKMFHKFGLKYGHAGLTYPYRIDNRLLGTIEVSRDIQEILSFLGLSYDRFAEGFDNLEDVFDYVISSPYFDPESFWMENLNSTDRKRNKKRQNYQLFIQYVNGTDQYSYRTPLQRNFVLAWLKDKTLYHPRIEQFFPQCNFLQQIAQFKAKEQLKRQVAAKFNGHLVMQQIGLIGAELGAFIQQFKAAHTTETQSFEQYCLNSTEEQINTDIALLANQQV